MNSMERLPAVALLAQALLQTLWYAWLSPLQSLPPALPLGLALAPMLAVALGALHSRRRMLLVGGIVSLLYFSHGVMELWSNPAVRPLAATEIVLAVIAILGQRRTRPGQR
jgi:uncharacterized membrane protein